MIRVVQSTSIQKPLYHFLCIIEADFTEDCDFAVMWELGANIYWSRAKRKLTPVWSEDFVGFLAREPDAASSTVRIVATGSLPLGVQRSA